ncbi:hypothetical protein CPLU01_01778 [Colletotrichum plurivorum]|uniref:MACPF domain-containing protein n=1 Tax=Colletotrichum plurivorum TaxID=2175906 RepID=A0A8H6NNF0_9PEZI|nr:hypothetical protein CPLU01_01778 [Colletotrichum plurivorum]
MERNPSKIMEMAKIEMSTNASSPASLDEAAWSRVMKNCNVMHGWYLDRQTNQIKMAPKPAFALKTGLNLHLPEREHKPVDRNSDRCCAPNAIPNYFVNDGSKIDIIVVEDDMRSSMVRNNFEKSSVDAKTGGGYAGLGIGVTAGSSREIQKGMKKEKKKFAQKMIGQYMLPRVTLILNPDDLIVTDEAKEAATEIYDKRDGALIRKFHQRFGEFFSHEVIIGGMLTSTKTWEGSETIKDEKKKEDFKQTIGLAVTTRAELKRLIESIADSASRDMEDIVKWFSREVPPPVSQFMQIPPLRDAFVQLRLKNMTSDDKYQYLVYQHHKKPTSIKITSNPSIVPKNFRGPRVISYDDTWGPQDGIWVIKHRDDGDLVDGSRVTIRTIDFEHRFLSVLRTSEYFFTPCITTSGHEPVWRVRFLEDHTKPLPQTKSMKGLPVKENGRFCLTYEFADNPYGFRDFTKDERGFSERVAPRTGCGRLVLVRPSGTAQGWEDRTVFLLDTEGRDAEGTVRVDGNTDVKVTAAMFYLDILASDGSDREKDILIPENTENTEEEAMKMMRVKTEPAPHVNGRH